MNYSFDKLQSIVLEEANVSALNNSYQTKHMICIEPNGSVTETYFNDKEEYTHYKASIDDVRKLYDDLISFIDNIENIELYSDDCTRDVFINYGFVSTKVPAACYDKDKRKLSDLIDYFVESKCKEE